MNNETKRLTKEELEELAKILELFESQTIQEVGVGNISGGFVTAEMVDYDDAMINLQLKWGIQSDCYNKVHNEEWKLDRDILSKTMSLEEKEAEIRN